MRKSLEEKLKSKTAVVGVIGMGYIGLSLLEAFGRAGYSIVGYDYNAEKMKMINHKKSYLNFMDLDLLYSLMDEGKFKASSNPDILKNADVLVISVPTTLDVHGTPDLSNLRSAFSTVFDHLKKGQLIVLQSSTYPGTTKEELLPILNKSHLKVGKDFYLGHVPEVADIGNPKFNFYEVPRIASGITSTCRKMAKLLYEQIGCKVVLASSTEVAEAAKMVQNAFRLVNISFINEMKILFDKMGMDVWEVIEAAASKPFGFMPFYPCAAVGGDCIPIAPFYLVWKSKVTGGPTTLLEQAGQINKMMPLYVFNKIIQGLNKHKKTIAGAKVLVLGLGYKKDVNDVRESASLKLLPLLKKMQADVCYHDPYVKDIAHFPEYPSLHLKSIELDYDKLSTYDAVVIVTDHSCYEWNKIVANSKLIIDTRNVTKGIKGAKSKVIKG